MLSMATQPGINGAFTPISSYPTNKLTFKPFNSSISFKPKTSSLHLSSFLEFKQRPNRRDVISSASAAAVEAEEEVSTEVIEETEKLGVVVKPMEKPRLVLKFVWMEKNIGLALDQIIPGHGAIPLSPYYFWPRKDAWEELKMKLESKPWISQKRMIILLNQATDIINLWQQSGGNLS
ncbi:30S ribosomal protein 3 protein [Thalictrum thalictroides]|uniref:30S ribosomal protein 3, chloroplastic n=1 Tax=Thalictrum thalictroides TaxID=46969 RepID=A0A7J6VGI4_THATH|nr:30S ribosomal protein 3 protein [Thalictrum thalictroides]